MRRAVFMAPGNFSAIRVGGWSSGNAYRAEEASSQHSQLRVCRSPGRRDPSRSEGLWNWMRWGVLRLNGIVCVAKLDQRVYLIKG